jgi:hypothetical protein
MKMSTKSLIAIALMLTTFLAMFAYVGTTVATKFIDASKYCWIEGGLSSDTYALYPYANESLDIGFSKYGEMIGYNEVTGIGLGLQYPGYAGAGNTYDQMEDTSVDPFCNEYMNPNWWMNGWFMDIKYVTAAGSNREIWAMALFSDGQHWGGDWYTMPAVVRTSPARPLWQEYEPFANPDAQQYVGVVDPIPPFGGRKTNGQCHTDPIKVIYDGPRSFVALCKTTVSDTAGGADLVAVYFTFIFNKAEKNVIILKDVKRIYTKQPMNIQFGNRGEWDLGMAGDTDSYTHWYTDEPVQYWDMDGSGDINSTEVATSFEFFKDYMLTFKNPKKWWDDVPEVDRPDHVFDQWTETMVDFPQTWLETQPTCYGRDWHWDKTIKEHSYAVAQVISAAGDYVGAMAVWPHPEFWSASNTFFPPTSTVAPRGNNPASIPLMLAPISRMLQWHKWTVDEDPNQGKDNDLPDRDDIWIKADDIKAADGTTLEPIIPFLIYEHDFKLSSSLPEYRVVSVYTLTDYHDADDADAAAPGNEESWSNGLNVIDREIKYQLDEIFDPWDIYDAMHKDTKRWVEFFDRDYTGNAWDGEHYFTIGLPESREVEKGKLTPTLPVYRDDFSDTWDKYCSFSERVLVNTGTGYKLIYPVEYNWLDPVPNDDSPYYVINLSTGRISFYTYDKDLEDYKPWYLPAGSIVKVLWSTKEEATAAEQWDENTELYPIDGSTYIFPLHHDITAEYKDDTEVILVEQSPELLIPGFDYSVTPSVRTQVTNELVAAKGTYAEGTEWMLDHEYVEYDSVVVKANGTTLVRNTAYNITWPILDDWTFEANITLMQAVTNKNITANYYYYTPAYVTLIDSPNGWYCKELDVKYHLPDTWKWDSGFIEEKFHIDLENATRDNSLQVRTSYRLGYPMDFVEKAWIHSEKALVGGDYVFHNSTRKLYMQDPVPAGEWLIINYTYGGSVHYSEFRLGDGKKTVFTLTTYPDLNSLHVYNTKICEQIVNETSSDVPPDDCSWKVPKADSYWRSSGLYDYAPAIRIVYEGLQEREWLCDVDNKTRGNWIIHESPTGDYFSTCDELVLDQAPLDAEGVNDPWLRWDWPGQELKIVFKVPSGRYEWGVVGKTAASVDSIGSEMVVAAFKNKLMEFGIGGLDLQDTTNGPTIPWLVKSPADSIGRYSLYDDWCYSRTGDGKTTSWPISSSNVISVGGTAPNKLTLYFNDFTQARIGTTITGSHGRAGIYAVTCWDRDMSEYCFYEFPAAVTDRYGYAIISTYMDKNGTVGVIVHGWSGQDTYYAAKWFDEHKFELQHINLHVTDLILKVDYKYPDTLKLRCPPVVTVIEKLGTISEKPQHDCP